MASVEDFLSSELGESMHTALSLLIGQKITSSSEKRHVGKIIVDADKDFFYLDCGDKVSRNFWGKYEIFNPELSSVAI